MTDEILKYQKTEIIAQTAELTGLLGMIPSDGTIDFYAPATRESMTLPAWLKDTRESFLKLSLLISRTLDIDLQ